MTAEHTDLKVIDISASEYMEIIHPEPEYWQRVNEISAEIADKYKGKQLAIIGILTGGAILSTDLGIAITNKGKEVKTQLGFMEIGSYGDGYNSSRNPIITVMPKLDIAGKHVLLVDDVADTRHTLRVATAALAERRPSSLEIAVIANKAENQEVDIPVHYVGFEARAQDWLLGCGMGDGDDFRLSRFIAVKHKQ
jgi:hypoxanthine phosphoribosyltransferase